MSCLVGLIGSFGGALIVYWIWYWYRGEGREGQRRKGQPSYMYHVHKLLRL